MTRKKFVKNMMSLGYRRDEAVALATRATRYGISYADRWAWEKGLHSFADNLCALGKGIRSWLKSFGGERIWPA